MIYDGERWEELRDARTERRAERKERRKEAQRSADVRGSGTPERTRQKRWWLESSASALVLSDTSRRGCGKHQVGASEGRQVALSRLPRRTLAGRTCTRASAAGETVN